jgi:hypothetical protein
MTVKRQEPPPNGSRLSCERPLAGAMVVDERPCPPEHKHSVSLRAITARQLQALARRRPTHGVSAATESTAMR